MLAVGALFSDCRFKFHMLTGQLVEILAKHHWNLSVNVYAESS